MTNKVTKPNQVTAAVVGAWANEVEVTPELVGDWIASKGDYSFSQTDHGWHIRDGRSHAGQGGAAAQQRAED